MPNDAIANLIEIDPILNHLRCNCDADDAAVLSIKDELAERTQQALLQHPKLLQEDETCARWLAENLQARAPMHAAVAAHLRARALSLPQPPSAVCAGVLMPALRLGWLPALQDAFANFEQHHRTAMLASEHFGAYEGLGSRSASGSSSNRVYVPYMCARSAFNDELQAFCADMQRMLRTPRATLAHVGHARHGQALMQPVVSNVLYLGHLNLLTLRMRSGMTTRAMRPARAAAANEGDEGGDAAPH